MWAPNPHKSLTKLLCLPSTPEFPIVHCWALWGQTIQFPLIWSLSCGPCSPFSLYLFAVSKLGKHQTLVWFAGKLFILNLILLRFDSHILISFCCTNSKISNSRSSGRQIKFFDNFVLKYHQEVPFRKLSTELNLWWITQNRKLRKIGNRIHFVLCSIQLSIISSLENNYTNIKHSECSHFYQEGSQVVNEMGEGKEK